jgi:hypothetical protein
MYEYIIENVLNNLIRFVFLVFFYWLGTLIIRENKLKYTAMVWVFAGVSAFLGMSFSKPIDGNATSSAITCLILYLAGTFIQQKKALKSSP